MLHGSPSDHRVPMEHLEPAFLGLRGWRRIYPDLPGHGLTPGSPDIREMDEYVEAVFEFVGSVAGSEKVLLGGISFGSYVALAIARRHGRRVGGLLLSVPEIYHSPREDRLDAQVGPARRSGTATAHLPKEGYREDTAWLSSLPWRGVSYPLYDRHLPIRCPTLLLFGGRDSPHRSRTFWKLLPAFSRATFAVLDGADHALWTEKGALARGLVRDWLERVEQSSGA
jgi:pimeloyl-ACP methyl ester carboxylesterase